MRKLSFLFIVVLLFSAVSIIYADINEKLFQASMKGDIETVRLLLDKGADVNAKNNDGETALMWDSENEHNDIVKFLKQAGARE